MLAHCYDLAADVFASKHLFADLVGADGIDQVGMRWHVEQLTEAALFGSDPDHALLNVLRCKAVEVTCCCLWRFSHGVVDRAAHQADSGRSGNR